LITLNTIGCGTLSDAMELAVSVAHELNQPLTGIMSNASAGRRFIAKGPADIPRLDSYLAPFSRMLPEQAKLSGEFGAWCAKARKQPNP
jgi:C4-dicarboxylate-specific signal transduction histidine kinase